jgi:hypothetical protein
MESEEDVFSTGTGRDAMDITEDTSTSEQSPADDATRLKGQDTDVPTPMVDEEEEDQDLLTAEEQDGGADRSPSEPPPTRPNEDISIIIDDEPVTVEAVKDTSNDTEKELTTEDQRPGSEWGSTTASQKDGDKDFGAADSGVKSSDKATEKDALESSIADLPKPSFGWGLPSRPTSPERRNDEPDPSGWGASKDSNDKLDDSGWGAPKASDKADDSGWGANNDHDNGRSTDAGLGTTRRGHNNNSKSVDSGWGNTWKSTSRNQHQRDDGWGEGNRSKRNTSSQEWITEYYPFDRNDSSTRRVGKGYNDFRGRINRGTAREVYAPLLPSLGKSSPLTNRNRSGYDSTDASYHQSRDTGWPERLDYSSPTDIATPTKQGTSTSAIGPNSLAIDAHKLKLSSQVRLGDIEAEFKEHFE